MDCTQHLDTLCISTTHSQTTSAHKANHTLLSRQLALGNQIHTLQHFLQPTFQYKQGVMLQLPLLEQCRRQCPEMFSEFSQLLVSLSPIRRRPRRPLSKNGRTQHPVRLHRNSRRRAWNYGVQRDVLSACAADGAKTASCGVVSGDAVEGVAQVVPSVGFL